MKQFFYKLCLPLILTVFISGMINDLYALEVPALRGRVNDYAAILSPQTVNDLTMKLKQLEDTDSTQVVILTIPSLEGDALEDFSMRVVENWKIGQKKLDNGALILVARDDRKIRIEVGYGLEGKLTDLMSGRIIDNIMKPRFREGNFDAGISEAADAVIGIVSGEFKSSDMPDKLKANPSDLLKGKFVYPLLFLMMLVGIVGSIKRILGGAAGSVLFPVIGMFLFPLSLWLLLLIPLGFLAGLILPSILSLSGSVSRGGFYGGMGGGGGGFSSFGGGGGGFGGGGSSGSW